MAVLAWQYQIIRRIIGATYELPEPAFLNAQGRRGWHLVSVVHMAADNELVYYFTRMEGEDL